MSNGPIPSNLTFLSSLPTVPAGSKVRFLGCVTNYSVSNAILSLQHAYPSPQSSNVVATVDVNLLLESLKRENTQIGAWVNVIGYLEEVCDDKRLMKDKRRDAAERAKMIYVKLKAIMLWSAGSLIIGEYERALEDRLRVQGGLAS
ncbi:hypothetical protein ACLMJK_000433 [Lecanora helva]